MKRHSISELASAIVIVFFGLLLVRGDAFAQASPTPTATPTPSCSISTLPDGSPPICNTGAETPPSYLGVSGGNINSVTISKSGGAVCCSGTFGALVQDSGGNQYVLSTNHVLARNSASGATAAKPKELIVQPSLQDLGCWQDPSDTVAQLSKWIPLSFKATVENQMDVAIAKVVSANQGPTGPSVPGVDPLGRILNIGMISTTPFPFNNLIDGMAVMKMGRTSCLTSGVIDAFDAMGQVVYSKTCNNAAAGVAYFDHQILVLGQIPNSTNGSTCSFASPGDSGALVLTYDFNCPQAIGVVFAGASGSGADSGGTIVAVNPIQTVLTKLNVSLVGQSCTGLAYAQDADGSVRSAEISDELRASIEHARRIKELRGRSLLKISGVAAVGIGAGEDPNSAMLNVYLTQDSPQIRSRVLKQLKGEQVRFKQLGGSFSAL